MSQSRLRRLGSYPPQLTQRISVDRHFPVESIIPTQTLPVHNNRLLRLLFRCTQHPINKFSQTVVLDTREGVLEGPS